MADFSEIVYRGQGPHQRKGGGFSTLGCRSEEELAQALANGWFRTLPEAIEAHDHPKPKAAQPAPQAPAEPAQAEETNNEDPAGPAADKADDDAPPTRAEMEQKATELGVRFNKRTADAKLLGLIAEALKARG